MDIVLNIGGILFSIRSCRWSLETIPANFVPFLSANQDLASVGTELAIDSASGDTSLISDLHPVSVSYNDLGMASLYEDRDSWLVSIVPVPGEYPRIMRVSRDFSFATLSIVSDDPYYDFVLDSMTRILFSQHAAAHNCLMLHASVVEWGGEGFLFMGESGTGKSTHSRLWIEAFEGCTLLNDDCPLIVRSADGDYYVSGTPWSGKTPCYRDRKCKVGGIAKLRQSKVNRFIPLKDVEAFTHFIPGMSVMTSDAGLYSVATSTALSLLESVPFGIMECLPDGDAARLCHASLENIETIMNNR